MNTRVRLHNSGKTFDVPKLTVMSGVSSKNSKEHILAKCLRTFKYDRPIMESTYSFHGVDNKA